MQTFEHRPTPNPPECARCKSAMQRDFHGEHPGRGRPGWGFPYWSDAFGVNPDQIPEIKQAYAKHHNMDVEIHPETGCLRVNDYAQFKRLKKIHGLVDKSGYD